MPRCCCPEGKQGVMDGLGTEPDPSASPGRSWVRSQSSVTAPRTALSPAAPQRRDWCQPPQHPSAPGPSTHVCHLAGRAHPVHAQVHTAPHGSPSLPPPQLPAPALGSSSTREICLCQQGGQELRRDKSASAGVTVGQRDKKIHVGKASGWIEN